MICRPEQAGISGGLWSRLRKCVPNILVHGAAGQRDYLQTLIATSPTRQRHRTGDRHTTGPMLYEGPLAHDRASFRGSNPGSIGRLMPRTHLDPGDLMKAGRRLSGPLECTHGIGSRIHPTFLACPGKTINIAQKVP